MFTPPAPVAIPAVANAPCKAVMYVASDSPGTTAGATMVAVPPAVAGPVIVKVVPEPTVPDAPKP